MLPASLRNGDSYPAPDVTPRLSVPVNGALGGGTFAGTLSVQRFVAQDGGVAAVGFVTGTMRNITGATSLARTLRLPARVTAPRDQRLQVDLGPVTVDVLWWRIDFGRIVLDVTPHADGAALDLVMRELDAIEGAPWRLARALNGLLDRA